MTALGCLILCAACWELKPHISSARRNSEVAFWPFPFDTAWCSCQLLGKPRLAACAGSDAASQLRHVFWHLLWIAFPHTPLILISFYQQSLTGSNSCLFWWMRFISSLSLCISTATHLSAYMCIAFNFHSLCLSTLFLNAFAHNALTRPGCI